MHREIPRLKLISINVSMSRSVTHNGQSILTGIFKEPVDGPVSVRRLNLEGDQQADLKAHGGACKAIYVYPSEHYAHWARELGRSDFVHGQFGENFTVEGMLEADVHIGDILQLGSVALEVTQPRVPCFKLGLRMGSDTFPNRFLRSGLVGFYLRVLQEGEVDVGMTIKRIRTRNRSMSIRDIHQAMHFDRNDTAAAQAALDIQALAPGWRRRFEQRLLAAGIAYSTRKHPLEQECCSGL